MENAQQDVFRAAIVKVLKERRMPQLDASDISSKIEVPSDPALGDYAFPCFFLARELKKSPAAIAIDLAASIGNSLGKGSEGKLIERVQHAGPYVNFFVNKAALAQHVIGEVMRAKNRFGSDISNGKRIVIEYPSPNTNKPLHLGHVRNMLLGQSISNLLSFTGHKVFQVNLNNDRGVHICKAMLAYERFSSKKIPDKKPDHFVGDLYVLFNEKLKEQPELEQDVQEMLRKWEAGDKDTMALWKKLNGWALEGFAETYRTFGIKFDKVYNESEHYKDGRKTVLDSLNKGLLKKDDKGNIYAELKQYGLPDKILLRADGTTIYITQDINLASLKYADFKMDKSIYVVGSEQILHFRQLFKILELLGIFTGELYHLAHGMVYLPEGRMKSREGRVVDADNLVAEMVSIAAKEVENRHKVSDAEKEKRSRQIGLAAIRFFILKFDPLKDFIFHPDESISFEGETGPYVQYAYARICSIFRKYGKSLQQPHKIDYSNLAATAAEVKVIKLIKEFPSAVADAAAQMKPAVLSRYLLDLAQAFSNFYNDHPILNAEPAVRDARLLLCQSVKQVLENGLRLLAIETLEEM